MSADLRPVTTAGVATRNRPDVQLRCLGSLEPIDDLVGETIVAGDWSDPPVCHMLVPSRTLRRWQTLRRGPQAFVALAPLSRSSAA
jgi:hypothetical protein